jgi:hypothetical protein
MVRVSRVWWGGQAVELFRGGIFCRGASAEGATLAEQVRGVAFPRYALGASSGHRFSG